MEHEIKFIIEDEPNEQSKEFYTNKKNVSIEGDESDDGDGSGTSHLSLDESKLDDPLSESDDMEWEGEGDRTPKVRLDKWLWAARFFKTRALARFAVEDGRVFYNGLRSKPTREIEVGATVHIRHGRFEKVVTVKGLSTRRRSTDEALQLFEEVPPNRYYREPSFNKPEYGQAERHDRMDYNRQDYNRGEYTPHDRTHWQPPSQPRERSNQFQRPSLYNPQSRHHNYEQQPNNFQERSSYYDPNGQPREKRQVRFLRRPNVSKNGQEGTGYTDNRFDNRMDRGNGRNEQQSYSQPYSNYNRNNNQSGYNNQNQGYSSGSYNNNGYNRGGYRDHNNSTNTYDKRPSYRSEVERKKEKEVETFE